MPDQPPEALAKELRNMAARLGMWGDQHAENGSKASAMAFYANAETARAAAELAELRALVEWIRKEAEAALAAKEASRG